jgi:hypothetical protein
MNYLNLAKGSRRDYQILYPPSRSNRLDGLSCLLDNFDLESSDGRVQQTFLSAGIRTTQCTCWRTTQRTGMCAVPGSFLNLVLLCTLTLSAEFTRRRRAGRHTN